MDEVNRGVKPSTALALLPFLIILIWFGLFYRGNLYVSPWSCTTLHFPERLMISSKTFGLAAAGARDPLVFRRSAAEPAQILVTAQLARDLDSDSVTYAAQKFKFDLYRGGRLHSISEAEWQAGIELKPVDLESLPTDLYAQDERGLVTGFDQSGTRGTGEYPTLSLDRKQVAVPSYFGLYTTRILFQLPDHEFWYWDVFEVSTHKKLSTIRGLAMSVLAPFAPGSATWLPDNRLVVSPGEQRDQAFIFCNCSNKTSSVE